MDHVEQLTDRALREPIPDRVKTFVWQRDAGACVSCGARSRLEFDHTIPLSMGGSNTDRNLQVQCETCNRAKGRNLV
jgi:5-methylcytosine-specific restriction endonuclease McrA